MDNLICVSRSSKCDFTWSLRHVHPFFETTNIKDFSNLGVIQAVFSNRIQYALKNSYLRRSYFGSGLRKASFQEICQD